MRLLWIVFILEFPYEHISEWKGLRLHLVLKPAQMLLNFHLEIIWHEFIFYAGSGCAEIIDVLNGAP